MRDKVRSRAIKTIALSIILLMTFVPNLGYIQMPWLKITLIHIPVIVISFLYGKRMGIFMGVAFGISSFISNTMYPSALSFLFTPFYNLGEIGGGIGSLIICFLPRIVLGLLSGSFHDKLKNKKSIFVSSIILTILHTFMVLFMVYALYSNEYAYVSKIAVDGVIKALMVIVLFNGVPEAIVAGIIVTALYIPLSRYNRNKNI